MGPLPLFTNNKERKMFYLGMIFLCFFSLLNTYQSYQNFTLNEIYHTNGTIINIYNKPNKTLLKIKNKDFTFFTSTFKETDLKIFDTVDLYLISKNISFYNYLKVLYLESFSIHKIITKKSTKQLLYNSISLQHTQKGISSLYAALYIATPLTIEIRRLSAKLSLSHLIAISGFHLGVMSFVLYFIIHLFYNKIHQSYFPYRNIKFDILIVIIGILLYYLYFLDTPPSLLRAFVMFVFALFLLRNNIQIVSFETLLIISVFILALFPKLLFSLSLWFSILGVFDIFLFIKYFKNLHKYIQFILFNFWIYMAINPITHYFFGTTAIEQLYSPILTIVFTFFYPISVIAHLLHVGSSFDGLLQFLIKLDIVSVEVYTPLWVLCIYIVLSLLSIQSKRVFIFLNILMIVYMIWLFRFVF